MLLVVKIGGDILKEGFPQSLSKDISQLIEKNQIILVHGGGDIVSEISKKLGHPPRFVTSPKGFRSRYTDKKTAEIYTMVMAGKINKEVVSALQGSGVQSIGLSGLDGGLVRAKRKEKLIILDDRGRKMVIDGGYTGQIVDVNTKLLRLLLDEGYTPVISAIAIGDKAEPLNVDGDRMAANIASSMMADKLLLLTDVEGVFLANGLAKELPLLDAKEMVEDLGAGMITKVYGAIEAIEGGVKEVIITSGLRETAITMALEQEYGTVIRK
jgi:acetylglutamate/LysW-gamma-L-alpha-aminoadipate kinase